MRTRRTLYATLLLLVLICILFGLAGCGEEEGREAREVVDEASENAVDFAEGFCGAIILAPLCMGLATSRRSKTP
jgi:hypothetical protein